MKRLINRRSGGFEGPEGLPVYLREAEANPISGLLDGQFGAGPSDRHFPIFGINQLGGRVQINPTEFYCQLDARKCSLNFDPSHEALKTQRFSR